jgi:hypothetical protein
MMMNIKGKAIEGIVNLYIIMTLLVFAQLVVGGFLLTNLQD